jgi:hypothetical protein
VFSGQGVLSGRNRSALQVLYDIERVDFALFDLGPTRRRPAT